ncbi:MAG TPA: DEDD exonuclease domain-containing protein [Actinomycetota bacterium]|nr:DEDD exonuclease domain-containing protein [Actinomycetota bacterium]
MERTHVRGGLTPTRQGRIDDLLAPLHEVTFCAVDLETTGASPKTCEIVEIGAVKSRGGEPMGTFSTLVRPAGDLPVQIQLLTGISPGVLAGAEPLPAVLPAFLEFLGGAVFVAHNARFDWGFITRACAVLDYPVPEVTVIDTARLARRLLRTDVRNVRLQTLAAHFRTTHQPVHRAFPDAAACLEVLWGLIERASAYGVFSLAELVELQKVRSHPHAEKVRLARDLPRTRGVYTFRNAQGEPIYVGKAADLRARVRSYFTSDERKRMGDLRAEVASVDVIGCATEVETDALEARLIERWAPRYNRQGVRRRPPAYLKLTTERHPRFSVTTSVRDDGALYVGPFATRARAQAAGVTLAGLFGVRTCTMRITAATATDPCPLYRLGSCHGPCTGRAPDADAHTEAVERMRRDMGAGLAAAREALALKLGRLASQGRFEEACGHRDAFADLVRTVDRARVLAAIAGAGLVRLEAPDGPVVLRDGRLATDSPVPPRIGGPEGPLALSVEGLPERAAVASWMSRTPAVRFVGAERPLAVPWPRPAPPQRIELAVDNPLDKGLTTAGGC